VGTADAIVHAYIVR